MLDGNPLTKACFVEIRWGEWILESYMFVERDQIQVKAECSWERGPYSFAKLGCLTITNRLTWPHSWKTVHNNQIDFETIILVEAFPYLSWNHRNYTLRTTQTTPSIPFKSWHLFMQIANKYSLRHIS